MKLDTFSRLIYGAESESESSDERQHKRQKKMPDDPPSVLLITTHGVYAGKTLPHFKSPMNIKKINAVTMGSCNYLEEKLSHHFASIIKKRIKAGEIKNMEDGSILIQQISEKIPKYKEYKGDPKDKDLQTYLRQTNRAYQISSFSSGEYIPDKHYVVHPTERAKSESPYFDTITLLTDSPPNDLIQEMTGRTNRAEYQAVTLSEILEFIKGKIKNLIIIDLSCSLTELDIREVRRINRSVVRSGYKRKNKKKKTSKKHKEHKKCKKSKSKGSKKKIKGCKIKRSKK